MLVSVRSNSGTKTSFQHSSVFLFLTICHIHTLAYNLYTAQAFQVTTSRNANGYVLYMGTGNTFGKLFKITTFGESHGSGVGVILDGCPPRIPLSTEDIQKELDRRRPGQSRLTTPRDEDDIVEILSGTYDGLTLGTPIGMLVRNKDQKSKDYNDALTTSYRPSHADATYDAKYGVRAVAGGGRSSARETIGRVAAGAVAKKILRLFRFVSLYFSLHIHMNIIIINNQ